MTEQEAKALGLIQLYHWSLLDEIIDAPQGKITMHQWITNEHQRISSDPTRRAEIVTRKNKVTLFVNKNKALVRPWVYPKNTNA